MPQFDRQVLIVEEYLWEEQRADTRHEFFNGQVYNMAGGSGEHSEIAVSLATELRTKLRGRGGRTYNNDMKVGISGNSRSKGKKRQQDDEFITYPDATVVCGEREYYKGDRFTLANPTVIFEILSPSTRNYDQNVKLAQYSRIPTLQAYVIIDSERVWVEQYSRTSETAWQFDAPLEDLETGLAVAGLDITIPLAALYEGITFEEDEI